jgi:hypothetical protein
VYINQKNAEKRPKSGWGGNGHLDRRLNNFPASGKTTQGFWIDFQLIVI